MGKKYWYCVVGPVDESEIPEDADFPLRRSIANAFSEMFEDSEPEISSGFGVTPKQANKIIDVLLDRPTFSESDLSDFIRWLSTIEYPITISKEHDSVPLYALAHRYYVQFYKERKR